MNSLWTNILGNVAGGGIAVSGIMQLCWFFSDMKQGSIDAIWRTRELGLETEFPPMRIILLILIGVGLMPVNISWLRPADVNQYQLGIGVSVAAVVTALLIGFAFSDYHHGMQYRYRRLNYRLTWTQLDIVIIGGGYAFLLIAFTWHIVLLWFIAAIIIAAGSVRVLRLVVDTIEVFWMP